MKVLLIQPKVCAEAAFPLGLASLVPLLEAAGHQVEGRDLCFDSLEAVLEAALRSDVVGVTVQTRTLPQARQLVLRLRSRPRGRRIPVLLGGPHPTLFPEASLLETLADAAVAGDGERVLPRTLEALAARRRDPIPGVAWRLEGGVAFTPPAPPVDLDTLPFADRDVFPYRRYSLSMRTLATPYTTMVTSRGCRRRCVFCPAPRLRPTEFAARSPEHVYEEMAWLSRHHGVRNVHLEDDDLLADWPRIEQFCELLCRRPLPLIWESVNGVPPERLAPERFRVMARAGCRSLVLSVEALHTVGPGGAIACRTSRLEAGSTGSLHSIEPGGASGCRTTGSLHSIEPGGASGYRWKHVQALVRAAESAGIHTGGYFIIGLPGSSFPEQVRSICLSYRLGLARANYSPFQLLPGSAMWEARRQEAPEQASAPTTWLAAAAHAGFYLRPRPFKKLVDDVAKNPGLLRTIAKKVVEQVAGQAGVVVKR